MKEKVNVCKSRKNRTRVKSIDLPDMIMHLAAKTTAYKPEVFSDSESGDDQEKDKHQKQQRAQNSTQGGCSIESFSKPVKQKRSKERFNGL